MPVSFLNVYQACKIPGFQLKNNETPPKGEPLNWIVLHNQQMANSVSTNVNYLQRKS